MSWGIKIRAFRRNDSERVIQIISDIIANEFIFKQQFDTLDSDILVIEQVYNKSDAVCLSGAESIDYNDIQQQQKIVGTTAVRISTSLLPLLPPPEGWSPPTTTTTTTTNQTQMLAEEHTFSQSEIHDD